MKTTPIIWLYDCGDDEQVARRDLIDRPDKDTVRGHRDGVRHRRDELDADASDGVRYDFFARNIVAFGRRVPMLKEAFDGPDGFSYDAHIFPR